MLRTPANPGRPSRSEAIAIRLEAIASTIIACGGLNVCSPSAFMAGTQSTRERNTIGMRRGLAHHARSVSNAAASSEEQRDFTNARSYSIALHALVQERWVFAAGRPTSKCMRIKRVERSLLDRYCIVHQTSFLHGYCYEGFADLCQENQLHAALHLFKHVQVKGITLTEGASDSWAGQGDTPDLNGEYF